LATEPQAATTGPIIFSHYQVQSLLDEDAPEVQLISPDLGLSSIEITQHPRGWQLPTGDVLTHDQIEEILHDKNSCFVFRNGQALKVEAFSDFTNRYYSLMPTRRAPTLLVSGIPMHRIKETDPVADTRRKIQALGKPYGLILDTTTGLGYTAISAARTATRVITIELNPTVHAIARLNPWSRELFINPIISKLIGDSFFLTKGFPNETFNAIIHDPPTFNLAGELYSQEIYRTFYRILKPKGRLFHYIGNPESKTGATVGRGVVDRLQQAGFSVHPRGRAFGVQARKQS
jgi:hypothetical protein